MALYVATGLAISGASVSTLDLTFDTGTDAGRKVVFGISTDFGSTAGLSVARDPTGANEAATIVGSERTLSIGGTTRRCAMFYLDLDDADTGSQTFRLTMGAARPCLFGATVYEGLATGAPEANEALLAEDEGGPYTAFTDSITTLSDNAVIFAVAQGITPSSWKWDYSETERQDTNGGTLQTLGLADKAVATAGATTVGMSDTENDNVSGATLITAAWAPAAAAGGMQLVGGAGLVG